MREIGDRHGASVARVALAWLLAKPWTTSVIIGAKTTAQLEDNIAAMRVLESEYNLQAASSRDADEAEKIANNQYQAGQADYTTVVVAQSTALSARRTVLQSARSRLEALVDGARSAVGDAIGCERILQVRVAGNLAQDQLLVGV